eukprot:3955-Heterococcus_DN1.PRE.1
MPDSDPYSARPTHSSSSNNNNNNSDSSADSDAALRLNTSTSTHSSSNSNSSSSLVRKAAQTTASPSTAAALRSSRHFGSTYSRSTAASLTRLRGTISRGKACAAPLHTHAASTRTAT